MICFCCSTYLKHNLCIQFGIMIKVNTSNLYNKDKKAAKSTNKNQNNEQNPCSLPKQKKILGLEPSFHRKKRHLNPSIKKIYRELQTYLSCMKEKLSRPKAALSSNNFKRVDIWVLLECFIDTDIFCVYC